MSAFVFVHGGWHGAWAWHKVVPLMESIGHQATALDLPAHGTDTTPVAEVTMADHVEHVGSVLKSQDEPAVLVGHSSAGPIISQVAEKYTGRVDTLVYLTAFLLGDGETVAQKAEADRESLINRHLVFNEEEGSVTVEEEAIREGFYADCSEADVALARSLLRPQPVAAVTTPVEISEEGFGSVRRVYIHCEQDRAITPPAQREMQGALSCDETRSLETSHSPFFSAPEALARRLSDIA